MNETMMTVVGNVVDDPRMRETRNGHKVTNFRIASTSRRYDREQERFIDNDTLYLAVTCWRAMGENVDQSIRKGQPVIVTGRFYTRDYVVNEQPRTSYELEATAVGHDLSRGVSRFEKVVRQPRAVTVTCDDDGIPVDDSDHWLDLGGGSSGSDSPDSHDDARGVHGDESDAAYRSPDAGYGSAGYVFGTGTPPGAGHGAGHGAGDEGDADRELAAV